MTLILNSSDYRHQVEDTPIPKRRKWVRRLANLEVEFVPVSGMLPVCSAMIRDISCGGVRLASIVPVEVGTTIRMRLKSVREARVVYVSRDTRGQWSIGCAFSEDIPPADIQQLLVSD
jgi:hypothetical protein